MKHLAQLVLHRVSRGRVSWVRTSSTTGHIGRKSRMCERYTLNSFSTLWSLSRFIFL